MQDSGISPLRYQTGFLSQIRRSENAGAAASHRGRTSPYPAQPALPFDGQTTVESLIAFLAISFVSGHGAGSFFACTSRHQSLLGCGVLGAV